MQPRAADIYDQDKEESLAAMQAAGIEAAIPLAIQRAAGPSLSAGAADT
jgi:hypothetical protein